MNRKPIFLDLLKISAALIPSSNPVPDDMYDVIFMLSPSFSQKGFLDLIDFSAAEILHNFLEILRKFLKILQIF